MAGRDGRLERVGAAAATEFPGPRQGGQAPVDQQPVPAGAVLVQQEDRLAGRPAAGGEPGGLDLHQRDQPVHLGLGRGELGQHAAQAQGLVTEGGARPFLARRGRVALVEDEIDHLQDRTHPGRAFRRVRALERHLGGGQRLLGPDDALGDGRLRDEIGPGDLGRGQPAEQAQGQRDPGRHGQDRVARREDQPQQVVVDVVGDRPVEIRAGALPRRQGLPDLSVLALQFAVAPELVDGAALGHGHQPGPRVARDTGPGPLLQRGDHRVLGEFLGQPHVARVVRQPGDQTGPLHPDHRVDRRVSLRTRHPTMTPSGPPSGQE